MARQPLRRDAALNQKAVVEPKLFAALGVITDEVQGQVKSYGAIRHVPAEQTTNMRNDMCLADRAVTAIGKVKGAVSGPRLRSSILQGRWRGGPASFRTG